MKRNYLFFIFTITLICIILPSIGFAQLPVECGDPQPGAPPCVPIDGGVSLLIAAGIGLGAKKAYQERMKKKAVTGNFAN
jgi:hypothetical protein